MANSLADKRRRALLCGGAALALQAYSGANARPQKDRSRNRVSLAAYGGVPGAKPGILIDAFSRAFSQLADMEGGELLVPPGVYGFGSRSTKENLVSVDGLKNVVISAYGATFGMKTTSDVVAAMFSFTNPNNVLMAGASFRDSGFDPRVEWRGMYCARAEATRPSSGFKMVDCSVDGAVGLFTSQSGGENKFLMNNISLHGVVKNAYYGTGLTYVGNNAKVDLICENVRRGCIAYGIRNADIRIKMRHAAGAPGSNGFISLISEGESAGNVENVRIRLDASGAAGHGALVHFYHQQPEARGIMRDVDVTVTVNNLRRGRGATHVFVFDHELPDAVIATSTSRGWDRVFLHGRVTGSISGRVIHNPSVSTAAGAIYVDDSLAALIRQHQLPGYFRIRSP